MDDFEGLEVIAEVSVLVSAGDTTFTLAAVDPAVGHGLSCVFTDFVSAFTNFVLER